jgi:hypothetical protein
MNIEIINKSNNQWLRYERDEEQWGAMIPRERGPRGNYSWVLIQLTFMKLLSLYISFYLLIDCMRGQSLNSCKRVGVSSHIPKLLGRWELSTISLGKSESRKASQREKIGMG